MSQLVTPGNLDNEFDVGGITPSKISLKLGAGLVKAPDGTISVVLGTQSDTRLMGFAGGYVQEDGTALYAFESTTSRTAAGRYTVAFDNPHPNGANYSINLTLQSDEPNRDQRKIGYTNKTDNGFDVVITIDDNGGTADGYVDERFDYTVFHEYQFLTGIPAV